MLKIGLTGAMASGKTTIGNMLKEMGIYVVSCDDIVREFHQQGEVLYKRIKEKWGKKYIKDDGTLNRRKMAEDLIKDIDFKKELENITHPLVKEKVFKIFSDCEKQGVEMLVIEAPLLHQAGWAGYFDKIILVTARQGTRRRRIMDKKKISFEMVERWLEIQDLQRDEYKYDFRIGTSQPIDKTRKKLIRIIEKIKSKVKK